MAIIITAKNKDGREMLFTFEAWANLRKVNDTEWVYVSQKADGIEAIKAVATRPAPIYPSSGCSSCGNK